MPPGLLLPCFKAGMNGFSLCLHAKAIDAPMAESNFIVAWLANYGSIATQQILFKKILCPKRRTGSRLFINNKGKREISFQLYTRSAQGVSSVDTRCDLSLCISGTN